HLGVEHEADAVLDSFHLLLYLVAAVKILPELVLVRLEGLREGAVDLAAERGHLVDEGDGEPCASGLDGSRHARRASAADGEWKGLMRGHGRPPTGRCPPAS